MPDVTVRAIAETRLRGGRVIAIGTSVVRALEGDAAAHDGELRAARLRTTLRIRPDIQPRIVDGLLSGVHERGTSHLDLVTAFVPATMLDAAYESAERAGYRIHEMRDVCLVASGSLPASAIERTDGGSKIRRGANARRASRVGRRSTDARASERVVSRAAPAG